MAGFDALDLIVDDEYPCAIPRQPTDQAIERLRDAIKRHGVQLACLVPYAKALNSPDADIASDHIGIMEDAIDLAEQLRCRLVRSWSGDASAPADNPKGFDRAVAATRRVAVRAEYKGIMLGVETHTFTETPCAQRMIEFLDAVDSPFVGTIYDPGSMAIAGAEPPQEAIELLGLSIVHVHAKDVLLNENDRHVPVGQGDIGWGQLIPLLRSAGYRGYVAMEYEKRWHPDLPDPAVGMVAGLSTLRDALSSAEQSGRGG
jgi:sugar phosphate isomerase/epimerase